MTSQVYANMDEGFIRLTTDEVRENLIDILRRVLVEQERIVLQRTGEEVAAIIPILLICPFADKNPISWDD